MDVEMDVCGMNELKETSLTPALGLRPVADPPHLSALHLDSGSVKPEGFVTAQLFLLSHGKAAACQLQEGQKCSLPSRTLPCPQAT